MKCRDNCGACCIAPSISSPLPDLPNGKPANMVCPHLDDKFRCKLFHHPQRPKVCGQLQPNLEMCGTDRTYALIFLANLEQQTAP
ncbi:MAG: YkgJ family cysteine cluster protein [Candidatus Schmidhempelia sp.]|nr:YkgJ family cysteine cluster protein [Candidatus Schmidhempelia sp.]